MPQASANPFQALDRPDVLAFLFHPRRTPPLSHNTAKLSEMRIPVAPGIHVGARFHLHNPKAPTLLFFHGNGEVAADYDQIGPLFTARGLNFMVVDYRGYGISDGQPTVAGMMGDCHAILAFMTQWRQEKAHTGPLIVMGRSLGSASALELAAGHMSAMNALIIESGFAWAGPLLRRIGVDTDRVGFTEAAGFGNLEKISRFYRPTRVIHAEFDQIIPFGDGQALYDACPANDKSLVQIPGAGHNDIFMRGLERYLETIEKLAATLTGKGCPAGGNGG